MNSRRTGAALAALLTAAATQAQAQLTISTAPTSNMQCSATACQATQPAANLNVADLKQRLAASDLAVSTQFFASIEVRAPIAWTNGRTLSLTTDSNVVFFAPLKIGRTGGLTLKTGATAVTGPFITYMPGAAVTFVRRGGRLRINNADFALVGDIKTLAKSIRANPDGNYALIGNYDAGPDGIYKAAPIATPFGGIFDGLGHDIAGLKIVSKRDANVGLFAQTAGPDSPAIRNLSLVDVSISAAGTGASAGAFVGSDQSAGLVQLFASGSVSAPKGTAGGLVGTVNGGVMNTLMSQVTVEGGLAGGLIGSVHSAFIGGAMASGPVTATGDVDFPTSGGLLGTVMDTAVQVGLAVGAVSSPNGAAGGLVGFNAGGLYKTDYWDKTTSGTNKGCGDDNCPKDGSVTGRTTAQLQARLPDGFSSSAWGQAPGILDGLPYLLIVPPR